MHRAYAATQDRGRLVLGLVLVALAAAGWSESAETKQRILLSIRSTPMAFALNGSRFAWVDDRAVVVADLGSGKRITLSRAGTEHDTAVGVAGATAVWLQVTGGGLIIDTLRAAVPGRQRRYGRWGDDDWYLGYGPRLGGVAADGKALVYSVYVLRSDEIKSDACYSKGICHWHVTGGSTFLVRPGSLSRRKILPPATAVAVEGSTVAAATLRRGKRFTNKAQIVLSNLAGGPRRSIGPPVHVARLVLHGDRLAAVTLNVNGSSSVRIWNVNTRRLVRTLRLPPSAELDNFAWAQGRLLFEGLRGRGSAILALDLHSGRQTVVARIKPGFDYGPWVWRGRVLWVEQDRLRGETRVKSAPL